MRFIQNTQRRRKLFLYTTGLLIICEVRMKRALKSIVMQAVKLKDPVRMEVFLKELYLQGFADGANADIPDDDDRYLRLKDGHHYECECPECGSVMELDLFGLLEGSETE